MSRYYPDDAPTWSEAQADLIEDLEHKAATCPPEEAPYWRQRAEDAKAATRARTRRPA